MSLALPLTDREYQKFEAGPDGETRVRVITIGDVTTTPSGLNIAGRMTIVTLNDSTWTALPATQLTERNGMSVQNQSAKQIKLHYDNTTVGYVGTIVNPDGERFYDIRTIALYGKCQSGTCDILIEELS